MPCSVIYYSLQNPRRSPTATLLMIECFLMPYMLSCYCDTHKHTHTHTTHLIMLLQKCVKGLCCAIDGGICVRGLMNLPWGWRQVRIPRWWFASVVVSACVGLSTGRYLPWSYKDRFM